MFKITQVPSSGSDNMYLTEITYKGSDVLIMCVVGVWRHILDLWCVCVCVCTLRRNIHTHHRPFETGYLVDNLSLRQFCPNTFAFPYKYHFIKGPFPFIHLSPTLHYLALSLHNTLEIKHTHKHCNISEDSTDSMDVP